MPVWRYICMECGREKREKARNWQPENSKVICLECSKAILEEFFNFAGAGCTARLWELLNVRPRDIQRHTRL